jgi:hypothetical protein
MKRLTESFQGAVLSRSELKMIFGKASATAECGGGSSVTCDGINCESKDGDGCSCKQASGSTTTKKCYIA